MTARRVLFGLGSAAVAAAFALGIADAARAGSTDALFGWHGPPVQTSVESRASSATIDARRRPLPGIVVRPAGPGDIARRPTGRA
jgi:hypothetical protein